MIKFHYTGLPGIKGLGDLSYDCFYLKQPPLQEKELLAFFTSSNFWFMYVVLKKCMWPVQENPVIINNTYKQSNQSLGSQLGKQH